MKMIPPVELEFSITLLEITLHLNSLVHPFEEKEFKLKVFTDALTAFNLF